MPVRVDVLKSHVTGPGVKVLVRLPVVRVVAGVGVKHQVMRRN
jgi:hypothetical protein